MSIDELLSALDGIDHMNVEECYLDSHLYAEAAATIRALRDHIRESITFAETRIADGIEMGATVWRIALEDIARENRAALEASHGSVG